MIVLMIAYTNEPTRAVKNPLMWTPGSRLAANRNTRIWIRITATAVRISERGATMASTAGRTSALSSAIAMTTITPSRSRSTWMPGSSHAVARKATVDTISVISRRLSSAFRPPRHSQSTRS